MLERSHLGEHSRLVERQIEGSTSASENDENDNTNDNDEVGASVNSTSPSTGSTSHESPEAQVDLQKAVDPTRTTSLTATTTISKPSSPPLLVEPRIHADITAGLNPLTSLEISLGHNIGHEETENHRFLENRPEPKEPSMLGEEPYPATRGERFLHFLRRPLRDGTRNIRSSEPRAIELSLKRSDRPSNKLNKTAPLKATYQDKTRAFVPAKYGSMFWIGLVSVALLLVLHIALVAHTNWSSPYGITIIMSKSNCRNLRTPKYLLILMVNIFATVVGLIADKGLRCVLSPSRQDLDAAHEIGEHMTVGVMSYRNWKRMEWPKKSMAVCFVLSSLPLSLFYNALLFQITPAHSSYQLLLSESFFEAKSFDLSAINITAAMSILLPPSTSAATWPASWPGVSILEVSLQNLQRSAVSPMGWTQTPFHQCEKTYSEPYRKTVGNVVLATKWNLTNETILGIGYLDFHTTDLNTLCPAAFYANTENSSSVAAAQRDHGLGFQSITGGPKRGICPAKDDKNEYYKPDPSTIPTVSKCYQGAPKAGICRLGYNNTFLLVITACLAVKTFCMLIMIVVIRNQPLFCLGDVIAEYIKRPDLSTKGYSCFDEIQAMPQPAKDRCPSAVEYFSHFREWGWLWYTLAFAYIFAWTVMVTLSALDGKDVANDRSARWWYIRLAILANSIQVVFTIRTYVERSWIFAHTTSDEWEDFRRKRQGLRVSFPSGGAQRRTLLMGYPLKKVIIYNAFNLAISYLLAALVSGEMGNVILPGDDTGGRDFNLVYGIKFGEISIRTPWLLMTFLPSILIIVSIIMVRLVVSKDEISRRWELLDKGYTEFKHTEPGKNSSIYGRQLQREDEDWMPKPGFNSLAVAIACQPSAKNNDRSCDEHRDESKCRLKWGVIMDPNPKPEGRILDDRGGSVSARQYWGKRQDTLFQGRVRQADWLSFAGGDERYRWERETLLPGTEGERNLSHECDRESEGNDTLQQAGHCGLSSGRVGAVQPMALYTGLGGGVDPRWEY